jgi:hypothetical protein
MSERGSLHPGGTSGMAYMGISTRSSLVLKPTVHGQSRV